MDWRPPFRKLLTEFRAASRAYGGRPDTRSGYPDEWERPEREAAFFHEVRKLPEGTDRKPSDLRWYSQFPEPWHKDIAWSIDSDEREHVFACGRPEAFQTFQDLSQRANDFLPPTVVVPEPLHTFTLAPTHLEKYAIDRWTRFVYQQHGRSAGFALRRYKGWMELSRNFFEASALAIEMSIVPTRNPAELAAATNAAIPPSERRTLPFWTRQLRVLAGRDYFAEGQRRFAISNIGELIRLGAEAGAFDHPELKDILKLDWRSDHADAAERVLTILDVQPSDTFSAPDVARRLADVLDRTVSTGVAHATLPKESKMEPPLWFVACTIGGERKILSVRGPRTLAEAADHVRDMKGVSDPEVYGPSEPGEFDSKFTDADLFEADLSASRDPTRFVLRAIEAQVKNGQRLFRLGEHPERLHAQFVTWIDVVYDLLRYLPSAPEHRSAWRSLRGSNLVRKGAARGDVEALAAFFHAVENRIRWLRELLDREWSAAPPASGAVIAETKGASVAQVVADQRVVFVVHGRNKTARNAMFDFLRALDLRPLEWDEAVRLTGSAAPYVGQVLEAAFKAAQAVVVVVTGDDEGRLRPHLQSAHEPPHDRDLTPQARLNVILEAGMALGSHADRTVLVEVEPTRQLSDLVGRHTVRFYGGGTAESRQELKDRLKNAGCAVKEGGTDWLRAGDFKAAVAHPR
jgi:predicted nucleotide-binding protein